MAKYIDDEAAIETIKTGYHPASEEDHEFETDYQWAVGFNAGLNRAIHDLSCAPAADVEPVRHGRWEKDENGCSVCSECGAKHSWVDYYASYCGDCGAKMDGEDGDAQD